MALRTFFGNTENKIKKYEKEFTDKFQQKLILEEIIILLKSAEDFNKKMTELHDEAGRLLEIFEEKAAKARKKLTTSERDAAIDLKKYPELMPFHQQYEDAYKKVEFYNSFKNHPEKLALELNLANKALHGSESKLIKLGVNTQDLRNKLKNSSKKSLVM